MNFENVQVIESYKQEGDIRNEAGNFGEAKIYYLKALEEFDSQAKDEGSIVTPDDEMLKKHIEKCLGEMNLKLARQQFEWGLGAYENGEFQKAVESFEEAIGLAPESDMQFLEEAKKHLDKSRIRARDRQFYVEMTPMVETGENFMENGNYAEAMIEFKEALKKITAFPPNHRFVRFIRTCLLECRRHLIQPYLKRAYKAMMNGKPRQAFPIIKRVMLLLDDSDGSYQAFMHLIKEKIAAQLNEKDVEELEEFESPEVWKQAIKDYEESLNLYSSYSSMDPLSTVYAGPNIFEDKFTSARRNLAKLYKTRGDRFRDNAQLEKAIRNYKEALKLFPRSDNLFHETFSQMKKLRSQMLVSQGE